MEYIVLILFFAMWLAAAISIVPNVAPYAKELENWKQIIISIIIIIGAPFMLIVQGIELILDTFLPEGWDNNDDDKFKY